jgi:hypothetical protein
MHHEQDGIEYYNSGSWTDAQATYITVDSDGVKIRAYEDPSPEISQVAAEDEPVNVELSDKSDWEFAGNPT